MAPLSTVQTRHGPWALSAPVHNLAVIKREQAPALQKTLRNPPEQGQAAAAGAG
jgi:hypothetical protein